MGSDLSQSPSVTTAQHVQSHIDTLLAHSPIYNHLFSDATLTLATPGIVTVQLLVEARHLNSKQSLHGSVSATLIDFIGGVCIASYDKRDNTGVSTDMHISFVSGAKLGDLLDVEGKVVRCGGTLAYTEATIRKAVDKSVVTTGTHTKYVKQR